MNGGHKMALIQNTRRKRGQSPFPFPIATTLDMRAMPKPNSFVSTGQYNQYDVPGIRSSGIFLFFFHDLFGIHSLAFSISPSTLHPDT
jgi:hypothetical protein